MLVHEKIKQYIIDNDLKQIQVAKMIGKPYTSFNAMLNGKRKMYPEDLRAICYALQISADFFISTENSNHDEFSA